MRTFTGTKRQVTQTFAQPVARVGYPHVAIDMRVPISLVFVSSFRGVLASPPSLVQIPGPNPSDDPSNVLWYRAPAATWNEALPIGSGRLGAMVFGGVADERLQFNEDTVWAGEKRDRINPAGARAIPEIRRLLFEGKPAEAEALADKAVIAVPRRMPPYQTLGDLLIRQTRLATSAAIAASWISTTRWRACDIESGGTTFSREVFASAVDHVIVAAHHE